MRMRRKRNLDDRIDKAVKGFIQIDTSELNAKIASLNSEYIDFKEIFKNENPIFLEIGCGKGGFAIELAKKNPDINVIAVEMLSNAVVEGAEIAVEENIKNLKFLCCKADYLLKYIKEKTVTKIFLNFSTPYPKKTYANNRLTHERFLFIYKTLLTEGGTIEQKTDNKEFFEYSLSQYVNNGFKIIYENRDLHAFPVLDNIETEYEKKFVKMNLAIYKVKVMV